MHSRIADELRLATRPVALLWSDELPENALQFKPGRWGCVMMYAAQAATRGAVAVFDRETYGCWGGGVGLGFGNCYTAFPGGEPCFDRFLSTGNRGDAAGEAVAEQLKPYITSEFHDDLIEGERYLATPAHVRGFVEQLPMREVPTRYVVLKPLEALDEARETPVNVTFFVTPHQLSALTVLANHTSPTGDRVAMPYAAACQVMGIVAYREGDREPQRAVVGMTDLSARKNTRGPLGDGLLSFTVPFAMLRTMEDAVATSFLMRPVWQKLADTQP